MKFNPQLLDDIASNKMTEKYLDLRNEDLLDEEIELLVSALKKNHYIESLNLEGNLIKDEGAQMLAALDNLKSLNLNGNSVKAAGIAALANSKIEELILRNNRMRDDYLKAFIGNDSLKKLHISDNTLLTEVGFEYLKQTKIEKLIAGGIAGKMRGNKIAQVLSSADISLTALNLMQNEISDEGVKALALNKNLKKLGLYYNQIGLEGAEALSHHVGLTDLSLGTNHLNDAAAKNLANIPTLTKLDISYNEEIKNMPSVLAFFKSKNPSINVIGKVYSAASSPPSFYHQADDTGAAKAWIGQLPKHVVSQPSGAKKEENPPTRFSKK